MVNSNRLGCGEGASDGCLLRGHPRHQKSANKCSDEIQCDRDIQDIFGVESEVAQEVADSLKAKLSRAEANTVATAPTKDTAAYDLFLKGEYEERLAENSLKAESFDQAATWYREAIARDPGFALAIARLVQSRMLRHWF